MGYIGDKTGPKMSTVIKFLGPNYFGVPVEQFNEMVAKYESREREGDVLPVWADEEQRHYILFDMASGGRRKFYLQENGIDMPANPQNLRSNASRQIELDVLLASAEEGINDYLTTALESGRIDRQLFNIAKDNTMTFVSTWLTSERIEAISPNVKLGLADAIRNEQWEDIVNAYRKKMDFGTGGIRGLMANDRGSIVKIDKGGVDARVLKGPNTLNNVVLLITSAGVAQFGRQKGFDKIVIGYDSRVQGWEFARSIAELFLANDYTVYLFDAPCPYPEVTFAIPFLKADMGILISASHNDYRYNGYKLSCGNGSQFDPKDRKQLYDDFIDKATADDIRLLPLKDAAPGKVVFLGGAEPCQGFDYHGHELMDLHKEHRNHIKSFLLNDPKNARTPLEVAFCPFHGAGINAVPPLLEEMGIKVTAITQNGLSDLNGLFPSFCSEPGREQQPDPGDPRSATVAVDAFKAQCPDCWQQTDILIGTDPDADRCGVVVKVPQTQQFLYDFKDYTLMPADDMWPLILWYRLKFDKSIDPAKTFVVLSHTTSDLIVRVAQKYGLGVIKSWVGFGALSAGVRDTWAGELQAKTKGLVQGRLSETEDCHPFIYDTFDMTAQRSYNLGAMEQSNGFSILGSPPPDEFSLGANGHVRDKDGAFAAVLVAEIAQWAKQNNTTIFELIDKQLYLDPDIGLFVSLYEPDPLDGEYPGIEGDKIKKAILRRAVGLYHMALAGGLEIGGLPVKTASIFRTGKYDHIYTKTHDFQFPDEGIRFYFDMPASQSELNHLTIRPSGTSNALRFHIQLHQPVDEDTLLPQKLDLRQRTRTIMAHIRELVGAPTDL